MMFTINARADIAILVHPLDLFFSSQQVKDLPQALNATKQLGRQPYLIAEELTEMAGAQTDFIRHCPDRGRGRSLKLA
jgi:hypothetical protein